MPVMTKNEVQGSDVRKGDVLWFNGVSHNVVGVERKPVWVYVSYEGGRKPLRLRATDPFLVERSEATPEEQEFEKLQYWLALIKRQSGLAVTALTDAKFRLLADIDFRPDYHDSTYESYIEAQTVAGLWTQVYQVAGREGFEGSVADAVRVVADVVTRDLLDVRHASRSSSVMANAVEAVVLDAKRQWLKSSAVSGW
jgi:hypothetical protein